MTHPVDLYVGGKIKEKREERDISLRSLGRTLGIAYQQIQKYEKGENRITAGKLYEFAQALRVPVGDFFEGYQNSALSILNKDIDVSQLSNVAKGQLTVAVQQLISSLVKHPHILSEVLEGAKS